jgi:uncharacterized protein (TIGR00255 family)
MTGFGAGDARLGEGRVVVETRSVNQRFLEVRARVPRELGDQAVFVEQLLRRGLSRGRVDVTVHCEGVAAGGVSLDHDRAREALAALRAVAREEGLGDDVPLSLLSTVPDLFAPVTHVDPGAARAALAEAVARCLDALGRMREAEGAELAADLLRRVSAVRGACARVAALSEVSAARRRERVRERVRRLVEESGARVDGARVEQELALLAEHSDVSEELTRLAAHADHFASLLRAEEPAGRRMDFLLQEMAREANTLGAKAFDAEVTRVVVELKAELERMREQVQNVE